MRYHFQKQTIHNGRVVACQVPKDEASIAAEEAWQSRIAGKKRRLEEQPCSSPQQQHCHSGCPESCSLQKTRADADEGHCHGEIPRPAFHVVYRGSATGMRSAVFDLRAVGLPRSAFHAAGDQSHEQAHKPTMDSTHVPVNEIAAAMLQRILDSGDDSGTMPIEVPEGVVDYLQVRIHSVITTSCCKDTSGIFEWSTLPVYVCSH